MQRTYTWRPEYDAKASKDYERKGADRLRDTLNKAAKVSPEKKIEYMTPVILAEYINKRKAPEFEKRSMQAKTNRLSGQIENTFDLTHRQGSISTFEVVAQLANLNNGVLPTATDVYEKTHSVVVGKGGTDLISENANKIMEEYNEKLKDYKMKRIEKDPNDVYLEVVGGPKKEKVYGLGSASQMYYDQNISSHPTTSSFTPSMISQLSSQVEELKKMVEESQKVAAESLKLTQAFDEKYERKKAAWMKDKKDIQKTLSELTTLIKSCYQPSRPPTPLTY